jgi:alkylation response protein AidB-like acyl-CoA dehydrogenase
MDILDGEENRRFRLEVRQFTADRLPADIARRGLLRTSYFSSRADQQAWMRILHERGWSVPRWPLAHGGTGWSPVQQFIFSEETTLAGAPRVPMGVSLIGPTICAIGSEEQKARHLPAIREGRAGWCQGFSEPAAGSDLAAVRTRAVRRGDAYIVNGQKLWTSYAHDADWGFFLVRTDWTVKPQAGISFLLIDMKSPGIRVRPIRSIEGEHHLNEVFLTDVEVPAANLLGEENQGWNYAKNLLSHERTASAEIFWSKRQLTKLRAAAAREFRDGRPVASSDGFRRKLASLEIDAAALEYSVLRFLAEEESASHPAALVSTLKIRGSELMQRITELDVEVLGVKATRAFVETEDIGAAPADDPVWPDRARASTSGYLLLRAATVFGGSVEIQRTIIAKAEFGL